MDALEPDLIILDEFQRFRRLLDGTDPAGELAQQLFGFRDHRNEPARVLLLSATPYKMYTLAEETDEAHYEDFLATLAFLMNDRPGAVDAFADELGEFRDAVRNIAAAGPEPARQARERVEQSLRQVMVANRATRIDRGPQRDACRQAIAQDGVGA